MQPAHQSLWPQDVIKSISLYCVVNIESVPVEF